VHEHVARSWTITETDVNGNTSTITLEVGLPEPYTSSNPPEASQMNGAIGGFAAGDGCSLTDGEDAAVPALITATNNSSRGLDETINFTGVGGSSIPGTEGPTLEWEALYGGGPVGRRSGTCDDQNGFGVNFANVEGTTQLYGFFDITGYYDGATSESEILNDTIIDVPSDQTGTSNGSNESVTITGASGPGVIQSSDGWEFDLAGITPNTNAGQ